MPSKRKQQQKEAEKLAKKASELRSQAKEFAGEGGEAVKEFASTTGSAAKEFAHTAFEAAKEMMETVEKAGERLNGENKPRRRRGRKFIKRSLIIGAGVALLANERVRGAITGAVRKVTGGGEPEPWATSTPGDGELARSATESGA